MRIAAWAQLWLLHGAVGLSISDYRAAVQRGIATALRKSGATKASLGGVTTKELERRIITSLDERDLFGTLVAAEAGASAAAADDIAATFASAMKQTRAELTMEPPTPAVVAIETATVDAMLAEADRAEFDAWKSTFGKEYSTPEEEATAFTNVLANARLSKRVNAVLKQPATSLSARSDQAVPLGGASPAPAPSKSPTAFFDILLSPTAPRKPRASANRAPASDTADAADTGPADEVVEAAFAQALSGAPTLGDDAPRAIADERAEAAAAADAIFNTTAGVLSALFTVSKSGVEIAQVGRARGLLTRNAGVCCAVGLGRREINYACCSHLPFPRPAGRLSAGIVGDHHRGGPAARGARGSQAADRGQGRGAPRQGEAGARRTRATIAGQAGRDPQSRAQGAACRDREGE